MCWTGGTRHACAPHWLRQRGQNPHATPPPPPACSRMATVSVVADDLSASLLTVDDAHRTPPRLFKVASRSESSGTNLGSWRTTAASTQESSSAATSCTSWFSPAARPRRRAPRSAILSWLKLVCPVRSRPWRQEPQCTGTDRSLDAP